MARKPDKQTPPTQGALDESPEVETLALGRLRDGRHALLFLRTRGLDGGRRVVVVGRELLEAHPYAEQAERSWRDWAWRRFFKGEEETAAERLARARALAPRRGEDVKECVGLGLERQGKRLAVVRVEVDEDAVVAEVLAVESNLLAAMDSLEREAANGLLEAERYGRARASSGWWHKSKKGAS